MPETEIPPLTERMATPQGRVATPWIQRWRSVVNPGTGALGTVLLLVFCAALSWLILGELLAAKWSVYGDHELRSYWIGRGRPSILDIPGLVLQTEVGYPGKVTRYRPTTYLFFAAESVFWGDEPMLLHLARLLNLFVFMAALALVLRRFFSPLVAAALCALLMTFPYWKFVWIGFSTNEQYMTLLAPAFCVGLAKLFRATRPGAEGAGGHWGWWLLCCLAGLLLAGVKENMTVILLPFGWLAVRLWRSVRNVDGRILMVGAICLGIVFIVSAFLVGISRGGADFYGTAISPGHRLGRLLGNLRDYPFPLLVVLWALPTAAGMALGRWDSATGPWGPVGQMLRRVGVLQASLLGLSLVHVVFYDGWPTDSRYAFPGQFYVFVSGVLCLYGGLKLLAAWRPFLRPALELVVAVVLAGATIRTGYGEIRAQVRQFTRSSQEFSAELEAILTEARAHPHTAIVVESATPYDFEPVFSINRFLLSYGLTNPIYLRLHDLDSATFPDLPFFHGLVEGLETISRTGRADAVGMPGTLPSAFMVKYGRIEHLKDHRECLSILLGQAPKSGCPVLAVIRY